LRAAYTNFGASRAIDGNTNGDFYVGGGAHTWPQSNPYWQVEGISGPVSKVKIWNRSDCCTSSMVGSKVELLDSSGVVLDTQNLQGIEVTWELDFGSVSGVTTVRVTRITSWGSLVIAEVEVLGSSGDSLLTGSSVASQSSDLFCGACGNVADYPSPYIVAPASLAIDGDTNGIFHSKSVFHTNPQVDPWWQVNLGLTATVSRVIIWNRTDAGGFRLIGAKIHLKDASGNILHTETVTSSGATSTFDFAPVRDVTAIQVARENTAPSKVVLNFAELEVFGNIQ